MSKEGNNIYEVTHIDGRTRHIQADEFFMSGEAAWFRRCWFLLGVEWDYLSGVADVMKLRRVGQGIV